MPLFASDKTNRLFSLVNGFIQANDASLIPDMAEILRRSRVNLQEPSLDRDRRPLLHYLFPSPDSEDNDSSLQAKTWLLIALSRSGVNPLVAMLQHNALLPFSYALHLLRRLHAESTHDTRDLYNMLARRHLDGRTPVEAALATGNSALLMDLFHTQATTLPPPACRAIALRPLSGGHSFYRLLEAHPNIELLMLYAFFLNEALGTEATNDLMLYQAQAANLRWPFEYYISGRRAQAILESLQRMKTSTQPEACFSYLRASDSQHMPYRLGLFLSPIQPIICAPKHSAPDDKVDSHYYLPTGLLDEAAETPPPALRY